MVNSITHKARLGLTVVIAVFVIAVLGSVFTGFQLAQATQWTAHTHLVIDELLLSLSALQDVETGQRGYLLTRQEPFLAPYNSGRISVFAHIDKIRTLTADNPVQQQNVAVLLNVAKRRVDRAAQVLEEGKRQPELSGRFLALGQGKALMDEFRADEEKMIAEEERLLARRTSELVFFQNAAYAGVASLVAVGIGLLVWTARAVQSFITSEQKRAEELSLEIESRKKTERALKETTVKLASSNNDLQQFAYVASHDLQEPLRAVVGFLTLLDRRLQNTLEPDTKEWLRHAVDGGQRMRTLVNDLLTYSRVESQGQTLLEDVDVNAIVRESLKNLQASIDETGAAVKISDLPKVVGDKMQLTQLFQNLVGNALKYRSPEHKPNIEINSKLDGKRWIFSVKDNGIGFDMAHSKRIFVIFQRLHSRSEQPGTGIGLALCKRIIERHNGELWCDSVVGEGSTFYFSLPIGS